jgi:hypothetical protein
MVDRPRTGFVLAIACVALAAAACGRGEYESRMEETLQSVYKGSEFNELGAPVAIPGTGFKVRLPKQMNVTLQPGSADARRVQPAGVNLPGLKLTYEGYVNDAEGGKWSYYCYLATTGADRKEATLNLLRSSVSKTLGNVDGYSEVSCSTSDGRTIAWQQLSGSGPQPFYYVTPDGQETYVDQVDGELKVYLREEGDQIIFIAWRVPASIKPHTQVDKLAPMVAGSLKSG